MTAPQCPFHQSLLGSVGLASPKTLLLCPLIICLWTSSTCTVLPLLLQSSMSALHANRSAVHKFKQHKATRTVCRPTGSDKHRACMRTVESSCARTHTPASLHLGALAVACSKGG